MTRPAARSQAALAAMLEARSVAVVGASSRPGSFGERMLAEVAASPAGPEIYPVNPRYAEIRGRQCYPSLADLPGPVDLVLLGVPDAALEDQLTLAAAHGDRAAVIFGNAHEDYSDFEPIYPDHPGTTTSATGHHDPSTSAPRHPDSNTNAPSHPGVNTSTSSPRPSHAPRLMNPGIGKEFPDGFGNPSVGGEKFGRAGAVRAGSDRADSADAADVVAPGLRERLAAIAGSAGMELCGAGCMGFVNVAYGLRATGYIEPNPLPAGPVALVTHSGSVFSAMLRMRRAIGFTLAVSSGQELVTAAPAYLDYALRLPETRVLALVLEAIREPALLRRVLGSAAERDIPVILLTVGNSVRGRMMVAAHSGALAAAHGGWEALARAYGVHRVGDLAELTDTLELFAARRPAGPSRRLIAPTQEADGTPIPPGAVSLAPGAASPAIGAGIATVHDSGLERAHAADLAEQLGVPFAQIGEATRSRLAELLDPGLEPGNPLDVWGTGADTQGLFANSLVTLADDPSVAAVALAVDLVSELDGDDSYPLAILDAARRTDKPLVVLSNLPSAIDQDAADRLRREQIPVLEGLRSGLLALGHLLDQTGARSRFPAPRSGQDGTGGQNADRAATRSGLDGTSGQNADRAAAPRSGRDEARRRRAAGLLAAATAGGAPLLDLLREYGIRCATAAATDTAGGALTAAEAVGYPVVLKTDEPGIPHKSDARGVILGVSGPGELAVAYADLAHRLGPRVLVCETIPAGVELALGIARDPELGPLIVVGAGGVLVEVLADRAVALPPVDEPTAAQLISELRIASLLHGFRGAAPADLDAIVGAITGLSALACELGDELDALDVNPLICGPAGAVAVDALVIGRGSAVGQLIGGGLAGAGRAAQEIGE